MNKIFGCVTLVVALMFGNLSFAEESSKVPQIPTLQEIVQDQDARLEATENQAKEQAAKIEKLEATIAELNKKFDAAQTTQKPVEKPKTDTVTVTIKQEEKPAASEEDSATKFAREYARKHAKKAVVEEKQPAAIQEKAKEVPVQEKTPAPVENKKASEVPLQTEGREA